MTADGLDGIEQAVWTRQQEGMFDFKDVVHHTDQGSQYTSIRFMMSLAKPGIQPSVEPSAAPTITRWPRLSTGCTKPS